MESFNALIMRLVHWIMYLTPLGVFSLLAGRLAEVRFGLSIRCTSNDSFQ